MPYIEEDNGRLRRVTCASYNSAPTEERVPPRTLSRRDFMATLGIPIAEQPPYASVAPNHDVHTSWNEVATQPLEDTYLGRRLAEGTANDISEIIQESRTGMVTGELFQELRLEVNWTEELFRELQFKVDWIKKINFYLKISVAICFGISLAAMAIILL